MVRTTSRKILGIFLALFVVEISDSRLVQKVECKSTLKSQFKSSRFLHPADSERDNVEIHEKGKFKGDEFIDEGAIPMGTVRGNNMEAAKKYVSLGLHKNWCDFILYCEKIGFGEIQNLKIQDGLPQIAEVVKKKISFAKGEGGSNGNE